MRNRLRSSFLILILMGTLFFSFGTNTNAASQLNIKVDGVDFSYKEAAINDGRTYIPVREFSELLGSYVGWDSKTKQVLVVKDGIELKFVVNEKRVLYDNEIYYMDSSLKNIDGVTYAPIRFIAEALRYNVEWNTSTNTIYIDEKQFYTVQEGDTLQSISQLKGISVENLMAWNRLTSDQINTNMKLFLEPVKLNAVDAVRTNAVISYTDQELDYLARIVYTEAKDEPYEGMVAVAAVVINRVQSPNFPNSIYDVIFQPGQFTPARNGTIYEVKPSQTAYKAAEEAIMGADPVNGALYFFNPDVSSSSFFAKKEFVKEIGNHSFYK